MTTRTPNAFSDELGAIRCTANPASITEADLLDVAADIRDWEDGEHAVLTRERIAEIICQPTECEAITAAVIRACQP